VDVDDLDFLIEAAAAQGELAAGVSRAVVAARASDPRLLIVTGAPASCTHNPPWTAAEEEFLRAQLGHTSEAEIGARLGRSVSGVHIHWKRELRLPSPSKDPRVLTANQVAEGTGVDSHVAMGWFDGGLFESRRLPTEDQTRVVERDTFLRWLLEPESWIYFNPRRVGSQPGPRAGEIFDAEFWTEARSALDQARREWGDQWWTSRRVADYHGIDTSDVKRHLQLGRLHGVQAVNLSGRHPDQYWRLWFVRRSEAIAADLSQYSRKKIIRQESRMDITPITRTVTDFSFTVSSDTLERYLADPELWAADVRAQLNGHTPGADKKARTAHAKNGHQGKVKCPQCGKSLVSQGMLERHLRQKHGQAKTVPAAE